MAGSSDDSRPGDGRFFNCSGPYSLEMLLHEGGKDLFSCSASAEDMKRLYRGVAPLQAAEAQDISFLDNRRYLPLLEKTRAGAVIVTPAFAERVPEGSLALVTTEPYVLWARISALFYPAPTIEPGVHPTAYVHPDAEVSDGVEVGPFAVVEARARIGRGTLVSAHAHIGAGVVVGESCRIGSHVSLTHSLVGDRVTIFPGARIGQDGFGFAVSREGEFVSVPQLGRVILGDGVEVGANTTIDRGSVRDTVIGAGSRLDNLVQVGHNVRLGRCCIVVAQAGISGSTELDDFVTVAAQAGLIGHIHVGTKARIGAQCGVMSDVEAGADVIGSPAMPFREFFRNVAVLRKLAKKGGS